MSKKLAAKFVREARKHFPREFLAYCIGSKGRGNSIVVRDLVFPGEGDIVKATEHFVSASLGFEARALREAIDKGWYLLGDLHTHCYDQLADPKGTFHAASDPAPSYQDYDRFNEERTFAPFVIFGVCELRKVGRKTMSRITFWPATPPPIVELT